MISISRARPIGLEMNSAIILESMNFSVFGSPSYCQIRLSLGFSVPIMDTHRFTLDLSVSHSVTSDSMDCSPPGSSVCGILQARILEWVAISSSRGSSQPRDQTQVPCTAGRFFLSEPPGKPTLDLKVASSRFQEPLQRSSPLGLGPSHYLESYLPWSSREPQRDWR